MSKKKKKSKGLIVKKDLLLEYQQFHDRLKKMQSPDYVPSPDLLKEKTGKRKKRALKQLKKRQLMAQEQVPSKAEQIIAKTLVKLKLLFEQEKMFIDCINPKTKANLRFDFWIPSKNTCIEYDGIQHFSAVPQFYGTDPIVAQLKYEEQVERDRLKDKYCLEKGITLIRLNRKHFNRLSLELTKLLR